MRLPRDIEEVVLDRAHKKDEPALRSFIADTLDMEGVRYDLYFARSADPTGIRFWVGNARFMNIFPGNSVQIPHGHDIPEHLPAGASAGPEYVKFKVGDLAALLDQVERTRDAAYKRIKNGS